MLTDLSKGPKIVSSGNQGLLTPVLVPIPQGCRSPHFSGWCLGEFSLACWFGGGAALLPLSTFFLPWWLLLPRSCLLSQVLLWKSAMLVRGWGMLGRYSSKA